MRSSVRAAGAAAEVIGRSEELEALAAFLHEGRDTPGSFVIEGEPGIGKSTLWAAAVETARESGFTVLRAEPAEAERSIPYAGLGDVFAGVEEEVIGRLPGVRADALRWALLLSPSPRGRVDRRAISVAVGGVLEVLAETAPVLVAIDDAQWLDRPTADALLFALRRVSARVCVLVTRRTGEPVESEFPVGLDEVRVLRLEPLSVGALHQLLRDRQGRPLARRSLIRIHEQSCGNPFYALELLPYLALDPFEAHKLPETLDQLLRKRVLDLPPDTIEWVELLSALGVAPVEMFMRAGAPPSAFDTAVSSGVVEVANEMVRFAHPLLGSLVYADLGRRSHAIHARLAELVDDPVSSARQLALATPGPDDGVARAVLAAASAAEDQGAHAPAAELFERALRLTPDSDSDEWTRRLLAAARAHQTAGDWERAAHLLEDLLRSGRAGASRAEALLLLAEFAPLQRQVELLAAALDESQERPLLRGEIECRRAWAARFMGGRQHARSALEIADVLGDDSLRARAAAVDAILAWFEGETSLPPDIEALRRDFASGIGGHQLVHEATQAIVNTYAPAAIRPEARRLFVTEYEQWRERDEPKAGYALWGLAWLEFWSGEWERAAVHAAEVHEIAIQYGLERPQDHLPLAVLQVHRGRLDDATRHSERALALALDQFGSHPPQHLAVIGLAAAWSGDRESGLEWLERADRTAREQGWREPSLRWWTGDLAEELMTLGRADEALAVVERWEADARRVGREWVLPHAWRCRGLLAAADGEHEHAEQLFERAIGHHDRVDDPFGRGRAELALGTVRRRARQKRSAREAIERALETFENLDALTWVDRARAELGRIGGRVRQEGLTETERRVAKLVAEGRSNREVADMLFLGERTVASHLTHIYAKLGVRTRTQLAGKVQTF